MYENFKVFPIGINYFKYFDTYFNFFSRGVRMLEETCILHAVIPTQLDSCPTFP